MRQCSLCLDWHQTPISCLYGNHQFFNVGVIRSWQKLTSPKDCSCSDWNQCSSSSCLDWNQQLIYIFLARIEIRKAHECSSFLDWNQQLIYIFLARIEIRRANKGSSFLNWNQQLVSVQLAKMEISISSVINLPWLKSKTHRRSSCLDWNKKASPGLILPGLK